MNKSRLSGAVCAAALVVLSNTSHAALLNPILGLNIGSTLYDVTFHTNPGDSFMALWDADNDGVWGGGSSVFTSAPLFWGDFAGARIAAQAITAALGTSDTTTSRITSDSFFVPWQRRIPGVGSSLQLTSGIDTITIAGDLDPDLATDGFNTFDYAEDNDNVWNPYASFAVSAVPVPAAVWLFGSGLIGLIGVARRKKAA